jgi:pimeloyl-ACP methyl ester carboxylesterase
VWGVTTFGLVHGAWHGAWCWDLVATELRRRGHLAVAVDLPTEDPSAGAAEYAAVVAAALPPGEDVVLVGHSLGGLTIGVAATLRPVRRLVFLSALLPLPGRSSDAQHADEPDRLMPGLRAGQLVHDDGSTSWRAEAAIATMYPDAPPDLAARAAAQLRRQHWRVTSEVTPMRSWPDAEITVVACAADAVVNPDWVRRAARLRFGVEARVLPGDHSPFLSRPADLVDVLTAG